MDQIDSPARAAEIRATILGKPALKQLYEEIYAKYSDCLSRCPSEGFALELGSGAGFAKQLIPELVTSDLIPYDTVDRVIDGTHMDFPDQSLRAIFMLNVFHHIPDASAFLAEAVRCLKPGGRVLIIDQHPGLISKPILKHAHHEPFRPEAPEWAFDTTGPLSGANGALAWIVFKRDLGKFQEKFPGLRLEKYSPHTPFRYWLTGGLKNWSLLPRWAFRMATFIDRGLIQVSANMGSFVDIELVRV